MARLLYDNQTGTLGASLSASTSGTSQTITGLFASAPGFATLNGTDYIPLTICDSPGVVAGTPGTNFERVWLTAYTAGSKDGTILRGQEGTSAPAHSSTSLWDVAAASQDVIGPVGSGPVQDVTVTNTSASSRTLTLGAAPTQGNILILMLATETNTVTATLSQTGVTWAQALAVTTNGRAELWIGTVGSGASATLTVTLSAASYGSAVLSEWSGLHGTIDTSATLSHAGTNGTWSPVIVPATDTLVVALVSASGFSAGTSSANNYPKGRFDTFPSVIVANGAALLCGWCWPGRRPIWMWGGTSGSTPNPFGGITASIK